MRSRRPLSRTAWVMVVLALVLMGVTTVWLLRHLGDDAKVMAGLGVLVAGVAYLVWFIHATEEDADRREMLETLRRIEALLRERGR